jgi:hypothetical protein
MYVVLSNKTTFSHAGLVHLVPFIFHGTFVVDDKLEGVCSNVRNFCVRLLSDACLCSLMRATSSSRAKATSPQ